MGVQQDNSSSRRDFDNNSYLAVKAKKHMNRSPKMADFIHEVYDKTGTSKLQILKKHQYSLRKSPVTIKSNKARVFKPVRASESKEKMVQKTTIVTDMVE